MTSPGIYRRIRVGDDTQTYCGRCKAERTHTVASMKSDTEPAEVICRTCHSKHRYRAGGAQTKSTVSGTARTRAAGGGGNRPAPPPSAPLRPARPYSAGESYAEGDHIEHPRYGRGHIVAQRGAKIDVRFGDGVRTLIHAG